MVAPLSSFESWLRDNWTTAHRSAYERGQSEMGSTAEGIRFISSKRGHDEIASSFVAPRTNLLPSNCLTRADVEEWNQLARSPFPL